jgi:hypothetical protein
MKSAPRVISYLQMRHALKNKYAKILKYYGGTITHATLVSLIITSAILASPFWHGNEFFLPCFRTRIDYSGNALITVP